MTADDIEELQYRMLMSQLGMHRICVLRRCRRKKRCFGPDIVCSHHHSALVEERGERMFASLQREQESER
jgi:hypothetical protein